MCLPTGQVGGEEMVEYGTTGDGRWHWGGGIDVDILDA